MTVGAVVKAAGCNRGTFYYYFSDLDVLAASAVREEFFSDDALVRAIFGALVEAMRDAPTTRAATPLEAHGGRIRAGERRLVDQTIRSEVQRRWESCLCAEGEHLKPAATFAIQFMVGGVLGFIAEATERGALPCPLSPERGPTSLPLHGPRSRPSPTRRG